MKRLHPISGVWRVLALALRLGSFGLFAGFVLSGPLGVLPFEAVFALAPLGLLAGAAYGVARYYRFTFELADGRLSVNSGVFDRQEREIPLGRIQNVDIERGPLQRVFGLAIVKFETAGGSATEAELNAITHDEARELQTAVAGYRREDSGTGRSAGGDETSPSETDSAADESTTETTAPPEGGASRERTTHQPATQTLYELSAMDLFVLALVSFRPAAPAVILFGVPFAQEYALRLLEATVGTLGGPTTLALGLVPRYSLPELLLIGLVAAVQFALAAWILSAVFTVTEYYGFRLDYVGEELRYRRGLIQEYSGSIPLAKIQTVSVSENMLMRRFGYAALSVETAGYAPGSGNQDASNTAIPLDDRETVLALAKALTDAEEPAIERPPSRSRRRYAVRYSLVPLALTGVLLALDTVAISIPYWYAPLAIVPLTALAGHLTWKHRGFALLEHLFTARSGFLVRTTRFVPYYRVQTVIDTRNIFQRRLSLATVTADTASTASVLGGDASAYDIDDQRARELHGTLHDRLMRDLRARSNGEHSHALDAFVDETAGERVAGSPTEPGEQVEPEADDAPALDESEGGEESPSEGQ